MAKAISQAIKRNPLQAITTFIAVAGVVVAVFNFYLLSNITPLEKRVDALEERNERVDPLVTEFIEMKGTFKAIQVDISELKDDIKYLVQIHTNR